MIHRSLFFFLTIILIFGGFYPAPARGDIYQYIDEHGTIHITNVPSNQKHRYTLVMPERVQIDYKIDPVKYDDLITLAAQKYRIEKDLIRAVVKAESNFNHKAVSPVGARGLMQLMPATAASLNVHDSFHPERNIDGGVRYLRYLLNLFQGNLTLALAAYNAGEGAVMRHGNRVPPFRETQTYVKRVQSYFATYKKERSLLARSN